MTLSKLDKYFSTLLQLPLYKQDPSCNGVQIQNSRPTQDEITKIAFAVDASLTSAEQAIKEGASLLFTHHGLFWDKCVTITNNTYDTYKTFLTNNLALYAAHIPLDAHNTLGNNYGLAKLLHLTHLTSFSLWRNMSIGVKGKLNKTLTLEALSDKIFSIIGSMCSKPLTPFKLYPFGAPAIESIGIVSGGAGGEAEFAVLDNLDCYITGEITHENYHYIKENHLNALALGHYQSEVIGVNLIKRQVEKELKLETVFLDIPTGL